MGEMSGRRPRVAPPFSLLDHREFGLPLFSRDTIVAAGLRGAEGSASVGRPSGRNATRLVSARHCCCQGEFMLSPLTNWLRPANPTPRARLAVEALEQRELPSYGVSLTDHVLHIEGARIIAF